MQNEDDPAHPVLFDLGTPKPPQMFEEEFVPPRPPEPDRTKIMEFEPPLAGATFSEDRLFRYRLFRRYREKGPILAFCCLNCSIANETEPDPSVTRMEGYAKRDGYAMLVVVNMCSFVATDPKDMKRAADPGGPDHSRNVEAVLTVAAECDKMILGWGNHGQWRNYGRRTYDYLVKAGFKNKLHCLRVTKPGHPSHCLYLRADLPFIPFSYDECKHHQEKYSKKTNLFTCKKCGVVTGHGDPVGPTGASGVPGEMFEEDL